MLLGVCNSTPNCTLYGETGAHSIELLVRERIINFWAKIVTIKASCPLLCTSLFTGFMLNKVVIIIQSGLTMLNAH